MKCPSFTKNLKGGPERILARILISKGCIG